MNTSLSTTPERTTDRKTIWVFTPSRTDPKDLEFILVQRQALLKDSVERVRESALTGNKHHLLFVGPRGCGKTHLVTLIVSRLSADTELADRLRIAWLNEDETCTTLLEFLVKVHGALEKRYPDEYREDMLSPAYEMKPEAALSFVSQHLLSVLGERTLVVVTENLDALFESIGDAGQKDLRAYIQKNPQFSIVATAQRLVDGLSDRARPFYGFFQTEHLKVLNVEEATQLLQNIAQLQEKCEVVKFLATSRGRSRVKAIHHLSGGNHRIYIVLAQFITRDSVDALLEPFMKMVDELTPYYQERIRWLPPLQRKIVEFLCICEGTVPVKEIAKRLFATPQTISSQLKELREKGYVEASMRGREALYEISEPLMRICVEVKDNQRHQPLRLLVDFLRVWYEDHELKSRLEQTAPASVSCLYLESAIQRNSAEGNLRKKILMKEFQSSLPDRLPSVVREGMIRELGTAPEGMLLAMQAINDRQPVEAISCIDEAIASEAMAGDKAGLLLFRAQLHNTLNDRGKEMADYTAVIELPGAPIDQVALALFNRGIRHDQAGETKQAMADYTAVIELPGAPVDQLAMALVNRGVVHGRAGEAKQAMADCTAVIELPGAPVDQVAMALNNRGVAHGRAGEAKQAIADYTAVIELPGAPVDQIAKALFNRGLTHSQAGEAKQAVADYTAMIELSGAPVDQVAKAYLSRGVTHSEAGEAKQAVADYTAVIELPGAPADQVATALYNRGVTNDQAGETKQAMADYTAVIKLPGAPVDLVARALVNRGLSHGRAGEAKQEMADLTAVIELPGVTVDQVALALFNRGVVYLQKNENLASLADFEALTSLPEAPLKIVTDVHLTLAELHWSEGRWTKGFQALTASLERGSTMQPPYRGAATDLVGVIFAAGLSPEGRYDKVAELLRLYQKHTALPVLGEAVVQHIGKVFLAGASFPSSDNLEGWATAWEKAAASVPDFSLSMRLLRTGINYVKAGGKEPGILLDLTSTERAILKQAFGLAEKDGDGTV